MGDCLGVTLDLRSRLSSGVYATHVEDFNHKLRFWLATIVISRWPQMPQFFMGGWDDREGHKKAASASESLFFNKRLREFIA